MPIYRQEYRRIDLQKKMIYQFCDRLGISRIIRICKSQIILTSSTARTARNFIPAISTSAALRHVGVLVKSVYSTIDFARAEALYDLPGDEDNLR